MITVNNLLEISGGKVFTISPDETVQAAINIMADELLSSLPVLNNGELVGIISERDYIRKAAPNRIAPWELPVREIMTEDVIYVSKREPINDCMKLMSTHSIRHLPVLEDGQLVGILSVTDVIRALVQ